MSKCLHNRGLYPPPTTIKSRSGSASCFSERKSPRVQMIVEDISLKWDEWCLTTSVNGGNRALLAYPKRSSNTSAMSKGLHLPHIGPSLQFPHSLRPQGKVGLLETTHSIDNKAIAQRVGRGSWRFEPMSEDHTAALARVPLLP